MVVSKRLRDDLHNKSLDIKKKIKELNNILASLYNKEKEKQSKNIYFIKNTVDKVSSASGHLSRLDTKDQLSRNSKEDIEAQSNIKALHKNTLKNISFLKEFYSQELRKEQRNTNSPEVIKFKKNLDALRLASEDLKRLDLDMNFKSKDWQELE
ncbi:hypothetical protein N9948_01145 [bacterium]|nr:hypothetical protein [bacterium]